MPDNTHILPELDRLNPWWDLLYKPKTIHARPQYTQKLLTNDVKHIDILIGARRVGKTSILYDVIQSLIQTIHPQNILYVTAELPIIQQMTIYDIITLYRNKKLHDENQPLYIFVDEIQEIPNWQTTLKYYIDTDMIKFYVTGSSSLILSSQTSKLTGRYLITKVFPLSYQEFLSFKKTHQPGLESVIQYLETGGYPEYVIGNNDELLMQTIESIMYRDLLSLYNIRNPAMFKDMLQSLCDTMTTPVSLTSLAKKLHISTETVQSYIQYLQDVYLVYPLYRHGKSHKVVKGSTPKYYLNDTGVLRIFSQTSRIGHMAENAVFTTLYRKAPEHSIFYTYLDDREVDFIYKGTYYDVKMSLIDNPHPDITYIVPTIQDSKDTQQITLHEFFLSH